MELFDQSVHQGSGRLLMGVKKIILALFRENRHMSIRQAAVELRLVTTSIHRILQRQSWHPYKLQLVKDLTENYFQTRTTYWATSWGKRLEARLPSLGSRVRVSVPPFGFRGGRYGVWVGFSRGFSRFPLLQISFHQLL